MRLLYLQCYTYHIHARIQRGGQGVGAPGNHKNIGIFSNTGPDPLKNHKATSQRSILGHHWHASETPFKWRLALGPIMVRF